MIETPRVVETKARDYAGLHVTVKRAEIGMVMGPGLREVHAALAAQAIEVSGPWFTHHLKQPDTEFDFEICVPVARPIETAGRVQPGLWPAMRVAQTVYHGDYAGLPAAWGELEAWIGAQGLAQAKDLWERYVVNPESAKAAAEWRTELNRPLLA